jgi:hypothetical protein
MTPRNILTNIGAALVFLQTVYPGIDADRILAAFHDGTWVNGAINLALMFFLYRDGKPQATGQL